MGLTRSAARSGGKRSADGGAPLVALAGNPNVGKSTVFNALTGMHQHTGNWSGKTVGTATGVFSAAGARFRAVDLPGTYSLLARSAEEEAARAFLLGGEAALTVVVCDATCLCRNLNLVLQTMELCPRVLVCVNLLDEARRRRIRIDLPLLERRLGVPVVGICARRRTDVRRLAEAAARAVRDPAPAEPCLVRYSDALERARDAITVARAAAGTPVRRAAWEAMRVLDGTLPPATPQEASIAAALGRSPEAVADEIAAALMHAAGALCRGVAESSGAKTREAKLDRVLTGRVGAFPVMLALLLLVFWITLVGANIFSEALSALFGFLEAPLRAALVRLGAPDFLTELLTSGMFRVLSWVVAVMLPPMAIFFPLFTLLEDVGYLPRVAYNLDRCFCRCGSCGKQALTMCMGFGCNAAGVVGCRIIDSPRERLIAMLTNSFVPCNGRFPLLVSLASLFFFTGSGALGGAAFLAGVIVFSCAVTLGASALLSRTLLRGVPSAFTLEMPPYRRPSLRTVLVRSVCDRTLCILGRAAAVAAPAGILLWLLANLHAGGDTILACLTGFLDPLGRALGMDGTILVAFVLGFPANETVIPIMMLGYLAEGALAPGASLASLRAILLAHGWTPWTAVCVILFSLMHWPCSTTVWTIRRESGRARWAALACLLPTLCGAAACAAVHAVSLLFV